MTNSLWMIMVYGLLVTIGSQLVPVVPRPPVQPLVGPGGSQYTHATVHVEQYGSGSEHYWLFEPADPTPAQAPVIVFLHGWGALDPLAYQKWIDHLVRRGNVVIYPKYQGSVLTPPDRMDQAVRSAVEDAWARLNQPQHVHPQRSDALVVIGHSLGAVLGLNLAAACGSGPSSPSSLPSVRALLLIEPGDSGGRYFGRSIPAVLQPDAYRRLPASTRIALMVGDQAESLVRQTTQTIWQNLTSIPAASKVFIRMQSDDHGQPPLVADHFAATAVADSFPRMLASGLGGMPADALDYYGFWKLADAMIDGTYDQDNGEGWGLVFGRDPTATWMGQWSDGQPVKPLLFSPSPSF